jgi:hypothetical protein
MIRVRPDHTNLAGRGQTADHRLALGHRLSYVRMSFFLDTTNVVQNRVTIVKGRSFSSGLFR